ncbi:MAG: YrdB family protein [Anaerolineales bacterium]
MGSHPLNLTLRFILELSALFAYGYWGFTLKDGWLGILLAVFLPIGAAAIWGILAVPADPSRSGKAPVPIAGSTRFVLELIFFGLASWAYLDAGFQWIGILFAVLVIFHYLFSLDRINWLLRGDL